MKTHRVRTKTTNYSPHRRTSRVQKSSRRPRSSDKNNRPENFQTFTALFSVSLNPAHPAGGSKAALFLRFGFTLDKWPLLASALLQHARENEVTETESTPFGIRYVVEGQMRAPDGTSLNILSAWYIHPGDDAPCFVTAHPLSKV